MTDKDTEFPISTRLKKYIQSTEKSTTQLAKELDMPQTSLNNIVSGRTKPSFRVLLPLANSGLDIHWLLTGDGDMLRQEYTKKIINQKNDVINYGGNNNRGVENRFGIDDQSAQKITWLEEKITLLESQLEDKENIINLLGEKTK